MTDKKPSLVQEAALATQEFDAACQEVFNNPTLQSVENLRINFLGRKGRITLLMEDLRSLPKEERPAAGKAVNILRQSVEAKLEELKTSVSIKAIDQKLESAAIDITLPAHCSQQEGSIHPTNLMRRVLLREFRRLGFTVYDGPEMDFEFYNFSALNLPDEHPARDMQDTFYVKNTERIVMRTHTSNVQIHCMLNEKPPLRIVAPGRVFRCDYDISHTPMFHQIEGFVVDENIKFSHLKGTIDFFLKAIFGEGLKTRFRPSFFPFTEPSAEMDLQCVMCHGSGCSLCKHTGWIEVGGCGMIHPNVFENVGYDSERYTGFAFGFGIDRLALLRYSLPDLRQLFDGQREFLGRFPVFP